MRKNRQILSGSWQGRAFPVLLTLLLLAPGAGAASAPVIRKLIFVSEPIFSAEERARVRWLPLGVVDHLHADTRRRVIERELVLRPGQIFDREQLAESARKLRRLGFFSEVELTPIAAGPDSVDVRVRTREVWTTEVSASYESFEGQALWSAAIRERNFLGMARSLSLSRREDEDRSSWSIGLGDRQMLDGTWRGRIAFSQSDDGRTTAWSLRKPFFHLGARWSSHLRYFNAGARQRFYLNSQQYIRPQVQHSNFEFMVLHRWQDTESGVWRWGLGVGSDQQIFAQESDLRLFDAHGSVASKAALDEATDETRRVRYLTTALRRATRRFAEMYYVDAMGQVEDIPLGSELDLDLGWATRAFDGSLAGLRIVGDQRWAGRLGDHLLRARVNSSGLISTQRAVNLRIYSSVTSHLKLHPAWRVAASLLAGSGSGLDRHELYSLGIDNGLRAASFREFAGDRIVRGNLELRWVHHPGLFGLITPGLTAFVDLGNAWYERERDLRLEDLRGAVGFGLRLGFRQGSQFVPMRFDLGWPVLYDIDRPKPVLSIGTGQVF